MALCPVLSSKFAPNLQQKFPDTPSKLHLQPSQHPPSATERTFHTIDRTEGFCLLRSTGPSRNHRVSFRLVSLKSFLHRPKQMYFICTHFYKNKYKDVAAKQCHRWPIDPWLWDAVPTCVSCAMPLPPPGHLSFFDSMAVFMTDDFLFLVLSCFYF